MKILGPEKGYVDLLNEATDAHTKQTLSVKGGFSKTPIRPSAAGECTRALYYQLMEFHGKATYEKQPRSAESHRLLSLGHSIEWHQINQFALLSDVFDIRYKQQVLSFKKFEFPNNPELNQWVEGSLDLVLWSDKHKCIADVKSKKDKFSSFYRTDWDSIGDKLRNLPSVHSISDSAVWVENLEEFLTQLNDPWFAANFLQLNLYACNPFIVERGIDHGAILQYNKNDSRIREIRFKPSQELYNKVLKKFETALTAVAQNNEEVATRDFNLGTLKCRFCPYQKKCWEGKGDATKSFLDNFPTYPKPQSSEELELIPQMEKLVEFETNNLTRSAIEQQIIKTLLDKQIRQIVHLNQVWELRNLKEGIVLRRGKLW